LGGDELVQLDHLPEEILDELEAHHDRTIAQGMVRIVVTFQEETVGAGRDSCTGENGSELPRPARALSQRTG
jgi:hypothetical protein